MRHLTGGVTVTRAGNYIYCVAIPVAGSDQPVSCDLAFVAQTLGMAESAFLEYPPSLFGSRAAAKAGVAGLTLFCEKLRSRPQKLYFLTEAPKIPGRAAALANYVLFFKVAGEELELCGWYGRDMARCRRWNCSTD